MSLLQRKESEYQGFTIRVEEYDAGHRRPWYWEVLNQDGVSVAETGTLGTECETEQQAIAQAKDYINWLIEDSKQSAEQQQIERSLWWLSRATEFVIDSKKCEAVTISGEGGYWIVRWNGHVLKHGSWSKEGGELFSDRESALDAYEAWRQRDESK